MGWRLIRKTFMELKKVKDKDQESRKGGLSRERV